LSALDFCFFVSRQRKKVLKIWIPDLELVLENLIGELGMTDEEFPENYNIYFGFCLRITKHLQQ